MSNANPTTRTQVKSLYKSGMPIRNIAKTVGKSHQYVGTILSSIRKEEGLPYRRNMSPQGIERLREGMKKQREKIGKNPPANNVVDFPKEKPSGYRSLKQKYERLQAEYQRVVAAHNDLNYKYNELNDWYGIRMSERDQMAAELIEWRDGKRRLAVPDGGTTISAPDFPRVEPPRMYEFDPAPHMHIDTRTKWQRWVDSLLFWLPSWR